MAEKDLKIEYIQYWRDKNIHAVQSFFGADNGSFLFYNDVTNQYFIKTPEGNKVLREGDYILKYPNGTYNKAPALAV